MASGTIFIKIRSVSTPEKCTSLFAQVNACSQSLVTSTVRHSTGATFDETFELEYDSDVHKDDCVVNLKNKKEVLATFKVASILKSKSEVTLKNEDGFSVSLSFSYANSQGHDPSAYSYAFPLAYFSIAYLWYFPQHYTIPFWLNLVATSTVLIYVGSHLSLILRDDTEVLDENGEPVYFYGEGETMKMEDAQKFPFIGSAALFGLFCAFKFLDPDWVNWVISFYFTAAGAMAVMGTLIPIIEQVPPMAKTWTKKFSFKHSLPEALVGPSPMKFTLSVSGAIVVAGLVALAVGERYFNTKHWTLNNVLGICFILQGISMFSIGSFKIAAALLVGLFFYDVFWVFGTPVMVTVAKKLDGPIKLLFPRSLVPNDLGKLDLSLLGLGDIVIPGFLISFMLRFDAHRARIPRVYDPIAKFPKPYFHSILAAYVVGLCTTLYMMTRFQAAQPALLYLVPACLGAVLLCGTIRGEMKEVWEFTEEEEVEEEKAAEDEAKKKK